MAETTDKQHFLTIIKAWFIGARLLLQRTDTESTAMTCRLFLTAISLHLSLSTPSLSAQYCNYLWSQKELK